GVSVGAVAGTAIGCIIAGLLIGVIVSALIYRRRTKNTDRESPYEAIVVQPESKTLPHTPPPPAPQYDQLQLSQYLLDTTPDKEIAGEMSSLGQLIQQHVENHYHLQPIQVSPAPLEQALVNLGFSQQNSMDAGFVVALALDPRTRSLALRHVVSFICFSSIDFDSRSRLSMLPAPVAAFLQSVPPVERQGAGQEVLTAITAALSRWRTLSAFLLHPQRSLRTPLPVSESALAGQAAALTIAMNTFLHHFVTSTPSAMQAQSEHLQAVILEFTKLGYVLLSDPASWKLSHYLPNHLDHNYIVLCAGLDKATDKNGR
ncbi:hypothetical protein GQ53DRAFT_605744, partial [Thozetella sp. PMI_491]